MEDEHMETDQPVNENNLRTTEDDVKKEKEFIGARSNPETVRIWNQIKGKYPTQQEALEALIRKGADVIVREEAGSDIADVTKEVLIVRNLTRRMNQVVEEIVRQNSSDLRLVKEDNDKERAGLNEKIDDLRERFDILAKENKANLAASKAAQDLAEALEKRSKELELSVTNSAYAIQTLRETNQDYSERIEGVSKIEAKLAEANKANRGLLESVRQSTAKIELLTTRNSELTQDIKLEREFHSREIEDIKANHAAELQDFRAEINRQREAHRADISQIRSEAAADQRQLRESLQAEHSQTMKELRQDAKDHLDSVVTQSEQTCQARIRAEVMEATSPLKAEIEQNLRTIERLTAELEIKNTI